jgi:hypothetical protein
MTTQQAIAVILTLLKYLDGKPPIVLSNDWKIKLAKAKEVLKQAGVYAKSEMGMYYTISISKTNGTASVVCLPIKEANAVDGTSTLDELFKSFLTGNAVTPTTEPNLTLD